MRALAALVGFALSVWLLSNCQSIVGIKDYTLTAAVNPECGPYCDLAQQKCPGSMGTYSSIYSSRESCTAVCNQLDPNQTLNANTLGCREKLLIGGEPMDCLKGAGPGGGGQCGSDCDAYCSLYSKICPNEFKGEFGPGSRVTCADACNALTPSDDGYDAAGDATGATVQCRLSHLSTAAVDPGDCANAKVRPADKCYDPPGSKAFCDNFCAYASKACPDALAVYENTTQCLAVCKALPAGNDNADASKDTMICRAYHISNVLFIGPQHCPHVGPGGDGHCGTDDMTLGTTGNCESYCILLQKACPEKFESSAQCQQTCAMVDGAPADSGYTVSSLPDAGTGSGAIRGTLQCRVLHLARALEHPGTNHDADCNSAIGLGECAMAAP